MIRIKETFWIIVCSTFAFQIWNFEKAGARVAVKESNLREVKMKSRQYGAQGTEMRAFNFIVIRFLFVYNPVCRTPHLEGISEGIKFLVCIVTSWHRLYALTYLPTRDFVRYLWSEAPFDVKPT